MCTAITYNNEDFYFGRTLDYEFSYGEKITITPRNYNFKYKNKENISNHYAIIGMAHIANDYPIAQLHWIISDNKECIVVESVKSGLNIYANPVGVLTNNPSFDKQIFSLNNYRNLSVEDKGNTFSKNIDLKAYSRGMGAIGLPGDLSSQSRFIRAAFIKNNSISLKGEKESVNQFFHILNSVEQVRGCCKLDDNKYEITIYSSCCNATKGIYYYTTYNNHQINAIDMHKEDLNTNNLITYNLNDHEVINYVN